MRDFPTFCCRKIAFGWREIRGKLNTLVGSALPEIGINNPEAYGVLHHLYGVADPELLTDAAAVLLRRLIADAEDLGDL
jgi:hypothetical protein